MTDTELLEQVARRLRDAGMSFMVVGGVASSYHGAMRFTQDVDLVVDATLEQLLHFVNSFEPPFYVSEVAAREAFQHRRMFNIIHPECEFKADIILLKDRAFDRAAFARRRPGRVWAVEADVIGPEDVILAKLEWAKRSDSSRQYEDAAKVALVQYDKLDLAYLKKWADEMNVSELLERALNEARSDQ